MYEKMASQESKPVDKAEKSAAKDERPFSQVAIDAVAGKLLDLSDGVRELLKVKAVIVGVGSGQMPLIPSKDRGDHMPLVPSKGTGDKIEFDAAKSTTVPSKRGSVREIYGGGFAAFKEKVVGETTSKSKENSGK